MTDGRTGRDPFDAMLSGGKTRERQRPLPPEPAEVTTPSQDGLTADPAADPAAETPRRSRTVRRTKAVKPKSTKAASIPPAVAPSQPDAHLDLPEETPTTEPPTIAGHPPENVGDSDIPAGHRPTGQKSVRRKFRRPRRSDQSTKRAEQAAAKADRKKSKVEFSAAVGGSRIWQLSVRWVIGLIAVVLMLVGALQIIKPPSKALTASDVNDAVASQIAGSGFPNQAAEAFAQRFAAAYYTWSASDQRSKRVDVLAAYLPSSIPDGWDGRGAQTVVNGPYITAATTSTDAKHGLITLALQVDTGAWLFPQVPVYSDGDSGFVIAGIPALGPPPGRATIPATREASPATSTTMPNGR